MKSAGLANACTNCGELMPYDPNALNQLCDSCNRLRALGGLSHAPVHVTPPVHHQYNIHTSLQHQYGAATALAYGNPTYLTQHQPTLTPPMNYGSYAVSQQQMASSTYSNKRKHNAEEGGFDYSNKRPADRHTYAPLTSSSLRQSYCPPSSHTQEKSMFAAETDDEDGEEFVDAPEDQWWGYGGTAGVGVGVGEDDVAGQIGHHEYGSPALHAEAQGEVVGSADEAGEGAGVHEDEATAEQEQAGGEADAEGEMDEDEVRAMHEVVASRPDDVPPQAEDNEEEDDDDLFAQTFGANTSSEDKDDPASDTETPPNDPTTAAGDDNFDRSAFLTSLRTNAPTTTTTTTTKTHPKPTKPKPSAHLPSPPSDEPPPILLPKHLAHNLRRQHAFHHDALFLLPRLPLAEHRYWIGVLRVGVPPRRSGGMQKEKNFVWMKGNRQTTVETVWRAYCHGAAEEDEGKVVLLCGYERVEKGVRCEELDYFADKRIILRAVRADHPDAKGSGLAEELIKEVAAVPVLNLVDNDEEDKNTSTTNAHAASKGTKQQERQQQHAKAAVVIEID